MTPSCPQESDILILSSRIKLRPGRETTPSLMEAAIRPRERLQLVNSAIEREITRQTERDHHWDDRIEVNHFCHLLAFYPLYDHSWHTKHRPWHILAGFSST